MSKEYIGTDVADTKLTSRCLSGEAEKNNEKSQSESSVFTSSLKTGTPEYGEGMISTL